MAIDLIHFYLQHLKLCWLFLGNACKISSGCFQLGYCPDPDPPLVSFPPRKPQDTAKRENFQRKRAAD